MVSIYKHPYKNYCVNVIIHWVGVNILASLVLMLLCTGLRCDLTNIANVKLGCN